MSEGEKETQFRELFTQNYSRLYHAALYLTNDSEAAKDVVNDTFASLWEEWQTGNAEKVYTYTYLFRMVRGRCVDLLRHQEVRSKHARLYKLLYQDGLLEEDEEKESRLDIIYKVMEEMPPRTRFVLEQCYFERKKYSEVAEIRGLSRDGIRAQVMKGLSMLRNVFSVNYKKGQ